MTHRGVLLLLCLFKLSCLTSNLYGQQVSIPRIELMPDFPQPYYMRNWKRVAQQYDSLVFNLQAQGQYLPFVFFREHSVNYPEYPSFGLHTSVGTTFPLSGEAINVIPAVVGATLSGIDKSNQFGFNWALMCQEFFNKRYEENIYLNHPVTSSGIDWWYETMPNIFYLQLKYLYPNITVFGDQLEIMASQWFKALEHMGGSATPWSVPEMNYRAWNMSNMTPLATGVIEPEAAGAIAWIMYQTYQITMNEKYLMAAEWALEFLNNLSDNPSYELQLAYGVYTAARMNAEVGTTYNLEKMVNWLFDRGALRGWGAIVGNWGGFDCSGLIGEANDQGNDYAFLMNGFQHAAALVPMTRYDERFATAIGKWILNLANASRLFYPKFLPANHQDNREWADLYDPNSVIAYEALRQVKHGKIPFATGDAIQGGWSLTNLMLYSSSHVGYLAAIIDTTNVEGVLQLDLLATDFYNQPAYPSFLLFNPHDETKTVTIPLQEGIFDIYDVLTNMVILYDQTGNSQLQIDAKASVMPVLIPAGSSITIQGNKSLVNGIVIDFNNGETVLNHPPRIKALSGNTALIETNTELEIFCTATDSDNQYLTYSWRVDDDSALGGTTFTFVADEIGSYVISCKVSDPEGLTDSAFIIIEVVDKIYIAPEIINLKAIPRKCEPKQTIILRCSATDANNDSLTYVWLDHEGRTIGSNAQVNYTVPAISGNYLVYCIVTDIDELSTTDSLEILVRETPATPTGNLVARYRLNGNALDESINQLHGSAGGGVVWSSYSNDMPPLVACLNGSSAHILLPSDQLFNFTQALTITFFMNIEKLYAREQYIVSHGSWQNRYKISLSNNRLRFTIHTSDGIFDLDSEITPEIGKWYHVAVIYDGTDAELWINAELDNFLQHSGSILTTSINPVIGQHIPGNNDYNFHGCIYNVTFYNYALSPAGIQSDMEAFITEYWLDTESQQLVIFPNPVGNGNLFFRVSRVSNEEVYYSISNLNGTVVQSGTASISNSGVGSISLHNTIRNGVYALCLTGYTQQRKGIFILMRR